MIGRLNADGSSDNTFYAGSGFKIYEGPYSPSLADVRSVALQPDGKIIVVGKFNSADTLFGRFGIARINANGSPDATFNAGTTFFSYANAVTVQPDGKILVAGYLIFNGTTSRDFVRLNANGSLDTAFVAAISGAAFIALQPDRKILVGGGPSGISRLNAYGSRDTTFNPGTGFAGSVTSLALQPDGKIVVGGAFTNFNGIGRNRIARLLGGGGRGIGDTTFGTSVRVYPNPAEDHVWIELGEEYPGVQVTVRNLSGQLLLTRQVGTAYTVELGLGDLPGGMYLLDVSTLTGEQTVLKIVKY
ncbi:MAG: T9SS C-terminal target domain-containing protein [Bacteroidetes bacterium]|nr:MAG: T9SS C-terminal target domain-containing protein [Bacteroidota bacterium]